MIQLGAKIKLENVYVNQPLPVPYHKAARPGTTSDRLARPAEGEAQKDGENKPSESGVLGRSKKMKIKIL